MTRVRGETCSVRGCTRRPVGAGMCKTHLERRADDLIREAVFARDGGCMVRGWKDSACSGALTPMHIVRRGYRALRWDPGNIAAGCWGHHFWLTNNPDEHYAWAEWFLGAEHYARLRARRFADPMDPAEVVRELEEVSS